MGICTHTTLYNIAKVKERGRARESGGREGGRERERGRGRERDGGRGRERES